MKREGVGDLTIGDLISKYEDVAVADCKNTPMRVLESVDNQLKKLGFEIILLDDNYSYNYTDDTYIWRIQKINEEKHADRNRDVNEKYGKKIYTCWQCGCDILNTESAFLQDIRKHDKCHIICKSCKSKENNESQGNSCCSECGKAMKSRIVCKPCRDKANIVLDKFIDSLFISPAAASAIAELESRNKKEKEKANFVYTVSRYRKWLNENNYIGYICPVCMSKNKWTSEPDPDAIMYIDDLPPVRISDTQICTCGEKVNLLRIDDIRFMIKGE